MIDEKATVMGKEYFQLRSPVSIPQGRAVTITTASRADIIEGLPKS
jgi:hypothetical protein